MTFPAGGGSLAVIGENFHLENVHRGQGADLRHPRLSKLEDDLEKIQGVTGVRVVGEERPTEIHVVAAAGRPPKQIVRDVQSLATTNLGEPIDHRIVSVVQLDEAPTPSIASTNGQAHRAIVEQVVTASKGVDGWVRVTLRMPDATTAEGAVMAGPTREERARGAVMATVRALKDRLDGLGARIDVETIAIQQDAQPPAVAVRANIHAGGQKTLLMGAAAIEDDVATAATRALLHALNRKLS